MKKIFILITITLILVFPNKIKAECSDEDTIRISKIVNNINSSYTFNESTKKFTIKFTNLTKDITIKDLFNNKIYKQENDLIINNVSSGNYKFNIYSVCNNELIKTRYIELPFLNNYYKNKECEGIEDYIYCNKWLNKQVSYETWYQNINSYKETIKEEELGSKKYEESSIKRFVKEILKIYENYYYIILPVIIITLTIMIYIKRKKEALF